MKRFDAPCGVLTLRSCAECPAKKGQSFRTDGGWANSWGCTRQSPVIRYKPDGSVYGHGLVNVGENVKLGTIHPDCPLPEAV